jgi:predicted PurR-regulated permease PerM
MSRIVFVSLVSLLFLYIVYPLLFPVAMGGVLAVLFMPLVERMERRRLSAPLASGLLTVGVTLLVLLPTSVLIYQGAKTAVEQLQSWKDAPNQVTGDWVEALLNTSKVHSVMEWVTSWFPIGMQDLTNTLQDLVRSIGIKSADFLGSLLSHLPGMAMGLAIAVVSMYFFMVDGRRMVLFVRRNSFFTPRQTEQLLQALAGVCRSVVLASVVSGIAQATTESCMLFFTRTPNAILVGVLVLIGSFVPVLGSAPVTLGVAIQQLILGRTVAGIVLLVTAVFVMTMDNFIRPWFLRGAANLHPLLAFVAAFGGLQTLGFVGVFLGPIIAALLLATIQVLTHVETETHPIAPPTTRL